MTHGVLLTPTLRTHLFLGKPDTEENRAGFVSTIPIGRARTPADVANACCYLASDEAEFVTGVNLEVCLPNCPYESPADQHLSRSTAAAACNIVAGLSRRRLRLMIYCTGPGLSIVVEG